MAGISNRQQTNGCWIVLVFVVPFLFVTSATAQQEMSPTIKEIQKAWQTRQSFIRSAIFSYKEQRAWPKGSISTSLGPELELRVPEVKDKVMPPADTTVDFALRLTIEDDKIRFEYEGKEWANDKQDFRPVKYESVFDGKTAKDLYPDGVGHANWPVGSIRNSSTYRDSSLGALRPLLLHYRPFVPTLQPTDLQGMTLRSKSIIVNERPCLEMVQQFQKGGSVHLWLDPDRAFVLVRRLIEAQHKPVEQLDITYRNDGTFGWVPTGWKMVSNGPNGGLLCSINAVLIKSEFNVPIEQRVFDIEFPRGARVQDEKKMQGFIIRQDGTKRAILPKDIGATYDEMLVSTPGEALIAKNTVNSSVRVGVVVAIGLLSLVLLVWRWSRSREAGATDKPE